MPDIATTQPDRSLLLVGMMIVMQIEISAGTVNLTASQVEYMNDYLTLYGFTSETGAIAGTRPTNDLVSDWRIQVFEFIGIIFNTP